MSRDIFQWEMKNISMLSETFQIIKYYGLNLKKKLGQNFLIDDNIVRKIINSVDANKSDTIIEIGPGIGTLTQFFFGAREIIAIEIDNDLVKVLTDRFYAHSNLKVICGDILKLNIEELIGESSHVKIISNLPYYISTAVITKCLTLQKKIESVTVMVQKEVGERIFAVPSTKSYGTLSIFSQYYADISVITKVSANCFVPRPNVESMIIKLAMKSENKYIDEIFLFELVRRAFSKRRKTLINCLENFYGLPKQKIKDILTQNNLDQNIRGEMLTIENFIELAQKIKELIE